MNKLSILARLALLAVFLASCGPPPVIPTRVVTATAPPATPAKGLTPPAGPVSLTSSPTLLPPTLAATASQGPTASQGLATTSPAATGQATGLISFQDTLLSWNPGEPPAYADSTASKVTVSNQYAPAGKSSLALAFGYQQGLKAMYILEKTFDLSNAQSLAIDLVDPDGVLASVSISLSTGSGWVWHESRAQSISSTSQVSLAFNLQSSDYKTQASGWQNDVPVADLDQVRRIAVILFPRKPGTVYLVDVHANGGSQKGGTTATAACLPQSAPASSPDKLALSLPQGASPALFSPLQFDLATTVQVKNPFDPAQIDLVVHYSGPDGKSMTIPAFWYQAYDPTGTVPCGEPGWKARFTPIQAGKWTAQAEIRNLKIKSAPVSFTVATTDARGFVRVNQKNPHYLAFDNGQTYFPIGVNMGWWDSNPLANYQSWMDKLHQNGGSLIRVWMADWSFGIEWNDTGLGDYTKREKQAWLLDQVFDMASQRDITIDLVLLNHGAFSETTNPEWNANPYNAVNGGPCQTPDCFATNPQARAYFQRRLRYMVARWGYSPNLLAWEWWNEEDLTPINETDLAAWIKEMTVALRSDDPYQHLITTSFASKNSQKVLSLPEISFTEVHLYDFRDPTTTFTGIYQDMTGLAPGKPVLFGEFGFSAAGEDAKSYDKDGSHLHNGEWMATFTGFASSAMYWWWDSYIDPLNLWSQFGSLSHFLQGVDLATLKPSLATPTPSQAIQMPTVLARAYTLQNSTTVLLWVKNIRYEAAVTQAMLGQPIHGLDLTLTGLKDGSYQVAWYDPSSQKWSDAVPATVQKGQLTLTVPDFLRDMAAKITPKG